MKKRRFGKTDHMSTVAILGAAAFSKVDQTKTDKAMELAMVHGVNHIDIAPSYGKAEDRLAPWMESHRNDFFLGCKTMERTKKGAKKEMLKSLKKLGTDHFDLYQIHAITSLQELNQATMAGGAIEALLEAKKEGLTRFIGITGHGAIVPQLLIEALQRVDVDSVLFPLNFIQYSFPEYRENSEELLSQCRTRDIGTMVIKSITKGPWGTKPQTFTTWYEPFSQQDEIQQAVSFVLSQDITGLCTASDTELIPLILQACEKHSSLSKDEQVEMIKSAAIFEPLFNLNNNH
jgi:predicted aldo/keto reductase-like oxidoreductase